MVHTISCTSLQFNQIIVIMAWLHNNKNKFLQELLRYPISTVYVYIWYILIIIWLIIVMRRIYKLIIYSNGNWPRLCGLRYKISMRSSSLCNIFPTIMHIIKQIVENWGYKSYLVYGQVKHSKPSLLPIVTWTGPIFVPLTIQIYHLSSIHREKSSPESTIMWCWTITNMWLWKYTFAH